MNDRKVRVRELAGWGLDEYEYRPGSLDPTKVTRAHKLVTQRLPFQVKDAVFEAKDPLLLDILGEQTLRPDLHAEMAGLEWSVGIVDLRLLLAFQRRLVLNPSATDFRIPAPNDWSALTDVAFGSPKQIMCNLVRNEAEVQIQSSDPNLHFRTTSDASSPIIVHAGSPFFEVAQYHGRWFLRDGYHRAYGLLRAGVFQLAAVVVQTRTLEELGAARPWFFPEEVLLSSSPPRVTDFLDDALVLEYERIPLVKTLRVTMEETLAPAAFSGENI